MRQSCVLKFTTCRAVLQTDRGSLEGAGLLRHGSPSLWTRAEPWGAKEGTPLGPFVGREKRGEYMMETTGVGQLDKSWFGIS